MSQATPNHILWASTPAAYAVQRYPPPRIDPATLETLFVQWQTARCKWTFMSALPLDQANALCDLILLRVPPHVAQPKRTKGH